MAIAQLEFCNVEIEIIQMCVNGTKANVQTVSKDFHKNGISWNQFGKLRLEGVGNGVV